MPQDTVKLSCPNCNRQFKVLNRPDRRQVPCPQCNEIVSLDANHDAGDEEETYSLGRSQVDETRQAAAEQKEKSLGTDDPRQHRWLCQIDGNEVGPIEYQQLRKLALAGTLPRDGKVRKADDVDWQDAGSIPGLFEPRKKKQPPSPPESEPEYFAEAPYEDVPGIIVLYGRIIMVASAVIGVGNAAGIVGATIFYGHRAPHPLAIVLLWGLAAFQSYIWFVCYKLGGGLMYGEKSAVQGLAVLMGAFCAAGIAIIFYAWPSQLLGVVVCAVSLALFGPPLIIAYKHKDVFE
jgi:hypothetical protein